MGETDVTAAAEEVTLNPFANDADWPSGSVMVMLRAPTVAVDCTVTFADTWLLDICEQVFTVTPVPKLHVGPVWKLLPLMVTVAEAPCCACDGVAPEMVGAGVGAGAVAVVVNVESEPKVSVPALFLDRTLK